MPGNLRKRAGAKGSGVTERDYLRARRQVLRESQICFICGEAINLRLKPICREIDTSLATVETEIPAKCGPDCNHARKAHPFSGSADHWPVAVVDMRPGDPRLTDPRAMKATHLQCNRARQAGEAKIVPLYLTSKDHFA